MMMTAAVSGASIILPLAALNDSGQNGIARLTAQGAKTEIVIESILAHLASNNRFTFTPEVVIRSVGSTLR
jgi:hypothetical protein